MRTYDFAPLGRYTVGFDHLFDLINQTARHDSNDSFPPYNILKTGPDRFRISLAVAGFADRDLELTAEPNLLTVTGRQSERDDKDFLFRGIAARSFERKFNLGDYVEVEGAVTDNGMLHIDLIRRMPDAMRPRTIPINKSGSESRALETSGRKAA